MPTLVFRTLRNAAVIFTLIRVLVSLAFAPSVVMPRAIYEHAIVLDTHPVSGGSLIEIETDAHDRLSAWIMGPPVALGDRITIAGMRTPFDEARNPGAVSQRALEAERGVSASIAHARVLAIDAPDYRDRRLWMPFARAWCRDRLHERLHADEAAVLEGALWGERGELPPELHEAFRTTGTAHVLVTAGLHLGIVAAAVLAVLRILTVGRASAAIITIAVVWLVCTFSGAHLPSVRAASMISVALTARALGAQAISMRSIAIGACIVAYFNPEAILSASFALSFSCVVALLWFARPIADWLRARGLHARLADLFAVSIAAQLGTWPLIAMTFHVVSLISAIANAIVVPLTAISILAGMLFFTDAALLQAASHLVLPQALVSLQLASIDAIATLLHIALAALITSVRYAALLPGASFVIHAPAWWSILVYDISLYAAVLIRDDALFERLFLCVHTLARSGRADLAARVLDFSLSKRMRLISALVCVTLGFCSVLTSSKVRQHHLRITVLDVGQGDGIVIETPHGHVILIDTGGKLELGAAHTLESPAEHAAALVLLPFLAYEEITQIDLMLLTHPHGDHVGGAAPVLRAMPVHFLLDGAQRYPGRAYNDALHEAQASHVPLLLARRGERLRTDDGVEITLLAPIEPLVADGRNDINENSIVAMLSYHGMRVLLTGDAGATTEERLLALGDDLHADILKVGHHGSAYSSSPAFIRAVAPRVAIISVGRHNLFGHPAPRTLETLSNAGSTIYRTDQCGAVTIDSDTISTMLPCR